MLGHSVFTFHRIIHAEKKKNTTMMNLIVEYAIQTELVLYI
jgi:hypothetical protein